MAATISANSAGGGGLVSSGDASGVLELQTAGVTALSIDASQKVTFANSLTSPTLVTPALGTPSSGDLSSCTGSNLAKAWANFNGVTTVTVNSSFNISSITRSSTGIYVVTFTTAMSDANYPIECSAVTDNAIGTNGIFLGVYTLSNVIQNKTSSAVTLASKSQGFSLADCVSASIAIFR
jgi:hypothetical protein